MPRDPYTNVPEALLQKLSEANRQANTTRALCERLGFFKVAPKARKPPAGKRGPQKATLAKRQHESNNTVAPCAPDSPTDTPIA